MAPRYPGRADRHSAGRHPCARRENFTLLPVGRFVLPGPRAVLRDDAIDILKRRHSQIRRGFSKAALPGPGRRKAFEQPVRLLAVHEAAEEAHVPPQGPPRAEGRRYRAHTSPLRRLAQPLGADLNIALTPHDEAVRNVGDQSVDRPQPPPHRKTEAATKPFRKTTAPSASPSPTTKVPANWPSPPTARQSSNAAPCPSAASAARNPLTGPAPRPSSAAHSTSPPG